MALAQVGRLERHGLAPQLRCDLELARGAHAPESLDLLWMQAHRLPSPREFGGSVGNDTAVQTRPQVQPLRPTAPGDRTRRAVVLSYRRVADPNAELKPGDLGVLPPLDERASLEDLIVALTSNGAYANFLDPELGSIEVGKLADLVVLDKNLFQIDIEQIPETEIVMTFFEGEQVFP